MQSEELNILSSSFGGLLQESHPVSHARKALPAGDASQQQLWAALSEGGWLDAGSQAFLDEYPLVPLLTGNWCGRTLLTLPYGASAFLLAALIEQEPGLYERDVVRDLAEYPASVRCVQGDEDDGWIDVYGDTAQYLRLVRKDGGWTLERYAADAIQPVDGADPCGALGQLRGVPVAQTWLSDEVVLPALKNYHAFLLGEMLGAAGATIDLAIAYANERKQFGKAIGQFQAVKHSLVNSWIELDNGRFGVEAVLVPDDGRNADLVEQVTRMVVAGTQKAVKASIQIHGGIGFSWEHDAQLYLKRVYRLSVEVRRLAPLLQA